MLLLNIIFFVLLAELTVRRCRDQRMNRKVNIVSVLLTELMLRRRNLQLVNRKDPQLEYSSHAKQAVTNSKHNHARYKGFLGKPTLRTDKRVISSTQHNANTGRDEIIKWITALRLQNTDANADVNAATVPWSNVGGIVFS